MVADRVPVLGHAVERRVPGGPLGEDRDHRVGDHRGDGVAVGLHLCRVARAVAEERREEVGLVGELPSGDGNACVDHFLRERSCGGRSVGEAIDADDDPLGAHRAGHRREIAELRAATPFQQLAGLNQRVVRR